MENNEQTKEIKEVDLTIKIPRGLYKELVGKAESEHVSLDLYCFYLLLKYDENFMFLFFDKFKNYIKQTHYTRFVEEILELEKKFPEKILQEKKEPEVKEFVVQAPIRKETVKNKINKKERKKKVITQKNAIEDDMDIDDIFKQLNNE